ncbi:hypothetical protein BaRGS_00010116 [Batillaria attramentaria]|uniref:Uncharacterized protein n=1 Tax=Batillaria attramentaria TaxID=370345 RepID=A0ABD0LGW9_9CAEN
MAASRKYSRDLQTMAGASRRGERERNTFVFCQEGTKEVEPRAAHGQQPSHLLPSSAQARFVDRRTMSSSRRNGNHN